MEKYTYLFLLAFTLSYPLFKSFENKIQFATKWKYLFPGIFTSALFFISWDIWFTRLGVWEFNPKYVLGPFIAGLPIEEWLFFFIVPFSCIFIHEVLLYFVKKDPFEKSANKITLVLATLLIGIAALNMEKMYTVVVCLLLSIFLLLHLFVFKSNYLGRFYLTWLVCLIPFLFVNGVLTAMPVVIYSNPQILNIRIYTIPVEDVCYGMLNILQVLTVYDYLKNKKA